jgi:exopolyphosphatase/guanosine-5'-triphosphate,3'-diphosphate pyrophosphatase
VLFYRRRADVSLPAMQARYNGGRFRLALDPDWLSRNPLTATALRDEVREWDKIGFELKVPGIELAGSPQETASAA